jgi:prevent-host-death family protein
MKSMSASAFRAHCLAVMDEVARTGEPVSISKQGRTIVTVVPSQGANRVRYPQQALKGSGRARGDIVLPVLPAGAWDALAGRT